MSAINMINLSLYMHACGLWMSNIGYTSAFPTIDLWYASNSSESK